MQISRRRNVLQGWEAGEDGSCCNSQFLDCSWTVWQSWCSPVSPCCQFPQLLPLAACRPVVQAWNSEIFQSSSHVHWWHLQAESANLVLWLHFSPNCHSGCDVHLSLLNPHNFCQLGDICRGAGESDSKRQNNLFGNLEGSQDYTRAQPRQDAATTQRGHSPQLGSCQAGL